MKVEATAEFILKSDPCRSQVFFERTQPGEHPHDQIGGLNAFRMLGPQFLYQLGMQPNGIPFAVLRLVGTQADARRGLVKKHVAPFQGCHFIPAQAAMQREQVNQPAFGRSHCEKPRGFLIRASPAWSLLLELLHFRNPPQWVLGKSIRVHQPVQKRQHGTEVEIQGLCGTLAGQLGAPSRETLWRDLTNRPPTLCLGYPANEKPGFLDVLSGAFLGAQIGKILAEHGFQIGTGGFPLF